MPRLHDHTRPRTVRGRRFAAPGLAAGAALLLVPAAHAATLGVDQRCYVAGETAAVEGSGFLPRSPITLTRAGELLPALATDNSGAVRVKVAVPPVAAGLVESQVELSATDGTNPARTIVNIATVGAAFTPTTGDPRTLRVSHAISGFGLSETKPSIYLHYVSPAAQRAAARAATSSGTGAGATAARARITTAKANTAAPAATTPQATTPAATTPTATTPSTATTNASKNGSKSSGGGASTNQDPPGVRSVRLGQLRGPCGVLRTSPRRLFPFKVTAGRWLLQYDTRPRYTKGTSTSPFLWVTRPITVSG